MSITRPRPWVVLAVVGLALGGGGIGCQAPPPEPPAPPPAPALSRNSPNVLLIVVDALRADRVGAADRPVPLTPHLDKLAARGTLFANAVTPAAYTLGAVGSLLTGLSPTRHGANDHPSRLSPDHPTVVDQLRNTGYDCAAFVGNGLLASESGFERPFPVFTTLPNQPAAAVTDAALEWMQARDRPFFCWVHYVDPHFVYRAPATWGTRPPRDRPAYRAALDRLGAGTLAPGALFFQPRPPAGLLEQGTAAYDEEVQAVDVQVGRLLDHLDTRAAGRRTLVLLTADHGESLGEHGLTFTHGYFLYDEVMRVPLIIAPPGAAGAAGDAARGPVTAQVSLLDLAPTILAQAGLPAPPGLDGRDLSPALRGERIPSRPVYGESLPFRLDRATELPERTRWYRAGEAGKWRMLRTERYKLIYIPRAPEPIWELYDLPADPRERHNLFQTEAVPFAGTALKRQLLDWLEANQPPDRPIPVTPELEARLRAVGAAP